MFFTVEVGVRVEFPQQQRVLQDSLDRFDQVRLQSGWMLLFGVSLSKEGFKIWVSFGWKRKQTNIQKSIIDWLIGNDWKPLFFSDKLCNIFLQFVTLA